MSNYILGHGWQGNRKWRLGFMAAVVILTSLGIMAAYLRPEPFSPHFFDRRSRLVCLMQKKVRRTREDIRREQEALVQKMKREIAAIVAEFHARLPRDKATTVGAVYARYSSRFQDSIADQIRTLFETAFREGIFIPAENVFFDLAVRGWKDRRPGLSSLRDAIRRKTFKVFLVFTTSRLFRKSYRAMQFVEEELVDRGIRGIFVKSHLDTSDGENWRTTLQMLAATDEAMVRMYGAHVQASHEGLFIRRMICTSLPLGYTGEIVPGEFTKRNLPRRRIIIDSNAKVWIELIFRRYVIEGVGIGEIARRLNDSDNAPVPLKSMTGIWTHKLVRNVLLHPAYRGFWSYGATKSKWENEKDYASRELRDEPLKSGQFEELRIVSDELWYRAQELLASEPGRSGRKPKDGDRQSRPLLLRGLFVCPKHERQMVTGGKGAKILFCPLCRVTQVDQRPLFTHLDRLLATSITCNKLAELICADDKLVADCIAACQRHALEIQKPNPEELKRLRLEASKLLTTIEFNRRHPGETDDEQQRTMVLIKSLQNRRSSCLADIAAMEARDQSEFRVPTEAEIRDLLSTMGKLLAGAASATGEDEMRTARRIIDQLTGGKIELFQMGEREKGKGWLQGRFTLRLLSVVIADSGNGRVFDADAPGSEIVIDYIKPREIDSQADEAKRLLDQNYLRKEIATLKNWRRSYVTKLINYWHDSRGLPRPDGRKQRAQAINKQVKMSRYKAIADDAMQMAESGLSNLEIGRLMQTSDATVANAIAWWYQSRGLPVLSAADRRQMMLKRARSLFLDGMSIKDIAGKMGYTPRGMKLALAKYFQDLGEQMPDGRTRRSTNKKDTNNENSDVQDADDAT